MINSKRLVLETDIVEIEMRLRDSLLKMAGKKIMITGAAGFLGRYFVALFEFFNAKLLCDPIIMVALDNHQTSLELEKDDWRRRDPNIEWIYGDAELGSKLPDNFDYVIHAAGIASPEHYLAHPLETIDVSVNATRVLLEKAKKSGSRLLFFSSSEIYGDPIASEIPTQESYRGNVSPRGPRACYDESKRLGETLCWVYQNYYSTFASVVRPFNIYGPGMLPNDYRVMPNYVNAVISRNPLKVYGSGSQTRTFCYITDAITAFILILVEGSNPDVYNVGNPYPEISMLNLAKLMCDVDEYKSQIEIVSYPSKYPKDDPTRRCPDITKLQADFNFRPQVSLEQGIKRFYDWALDFYATLPKNLNSL